MTFSVRWRRENAPPGYRVFSAPSEIAAIELAPEAAGLRIAIQKPQGLPIVLLTEAFDQALAAGRRGESSKKDWHDAVRMFANYLIKHYPRVRAWSDLPGRSS